MKKRTVHSSVRCVDTLLQIAGRSFLGVPSHACTISEDTEIEILDGPVNVQDAEGEITEVVRVRHRAAHGKIHEGWILYSFVR